MANEHLRPFQCVFSRSDMNSAAGSQRMLFAVLAVDADHACDLVHENLGLSLAKLTAEEADYGQDLLDRLALKPNHPVELSSNT